MTFRLTATGLAAAIVALAAAAPQGFAASQTIILAQAGDEAATAEAQTILAEAANLTSLSEDDLKSRIKSARQLMKNEGVPAEVRDQLKDFVEAARKELITRQAQQKQEEQPAQQEAQPEQQKQEEQPAQQEAQPTEQPAAPEVDAKAMAQAEAILNDAGNIASLSDKDLRARERTASRLLKKGGLPDDVTAGLQSFVGAVQQELETRQAGAKQTEQPATEQAQPQEETTPPAASDTAQPAPTLEPAQETTETAPAQVDERNVAQANKLLADQRPLSEISDGELRKRVDAARKILKRGNLPIDVRDQLRSLIETSRAEIIARESPQQEPSQQQAAPVEKVPELPPSKAENRAVENPDVSPEAEAQAKKLLAESASVEKLNDDQLRARLERFRDVLEAGNLSRETERDLRDRLKAERQILRTRVATREMEQQASQQGGQQGGFNNGPVEIRQFNERPSRREMDFVVKDRRRLRELSEFELRRRIFVYRELMRDERYSDEQLVYIRGELDKARRELRRRFEEDKLARADNFKRRRQKNDLDIDVNIVLQPEGGRPRPPVIWAAEEDEEEIERQLVARPIRRLPRQYPREVIFEEPETVLTQPEVRDSLPGVEVDTINFGFNEAFVREEEVGNLESIATTIEEVVAAHPEEVFMIEGHTDAVGSDSYNLGLSRQRAEGVKKILLEFYNIGEDNLVAVGLGERYLKIPTPEPEQENRRVTLRRATPLISGYEQEEE
ncbi:MAG TPA: OmpA family protein [Aestuariivirgaceae bacterium]|nr:OmpA family protein [Aestuariivirgaceae bacterium]